MNRSDDKPCSSPSQLSIINQESGEMPETLSKSDAMWFPVIASFTLGGLYLVIKVIVYSINVYSWWYLS